MRIVQYVADAPATEDRTGRCTLEFTQEQMESRCATSSGASVSTTYRYEVIRANVYAATMTASTFRTQLVGSTREYEYHVDGDRLVIVTRPPATTPAASSAATRVESESARVPCPR